MKILQVLLLALSLLLVVLTRLTRATCSGNEISKTCECSAVYTAGEYDLVDANGVSIAEEAKLKTMFTGKSYVDCSPSPTCDVERARACEKYCKEHVIQALSSGNNAVNELTMTNMCQLAMKEEPLFENGIRLFSSWKYGACGKGYNIIKKNVCCNRVCECELLRRNPSSQVENLIRSLPKKYKAFECDKALDEPCVDECRKNMSPVIKLPELDNSEAYNFDIFANQATGSEVCNLMGGSVAIRSPGEDILIRASTNRYKHRNFIHLGRGCCHQTGASVCDCQLVIKSFNPSALLNKPIKTLSLPATERSYMCQEELTNCMKACRNTILASTMVQSETTSNLQPIRNNALAQEVCFGLQAVFPNQNDELEAKYADGIDVFIEFNAGRVFPEHEELSLGRICCVNMGGTLTPTTACPRVVSSSSP